MLAGMEPRPRSPRERPAKPPLTREWIIAETIAIVRREGLEKATMRRVAQALETGPASLYAYVANTAELHAAVLDQLIGSMPAETTGSWEARLEALLSSYAAVLYSYPGLARSALVLRPTGPHAVGLYDRILGLLLESGIPAGSAAWGVDLLLQYITASAAEHSASSPGEASKQDETGLGELARALRTADPAENPHIAAHADAVLSGTPAQRTAWAVRALVAGMAATPIPTAIPTPTYTPTCGQP